MLTRPVIVATVLLAAFVAGCDRKSPDAADADASAPSAVVAPEPAEVPAPAVDAPLSQPEALAMLTAVNEHDIAAAEQARSKGVQGAVLEYADLVHEEHVRNLAETTAIATTAGGMQETDPVVAMRQKAQAELQALGALDGEAYAAAYIDAMVKGHEEALAMIDNRLLPAATDDAVRNHLTATRGHIAMHLDEGKRLQSR